MTDSRAVGGLTEDDRSLPQPEPGAGREPGGKGPTAASFLDDDRVRKVVGILAIAIGALWLGLFLQRRVLDVPFGIFVQGMVIGGLTALIAFGLALIYRGNRIINFAQGDLGGIPASLGVVLILGRSFPYFVALPIAIAAAIVLGAFVEFVFVRRFFKAPRLILTVVTIGVSQILAGVATALPRAFGLDGLQNTIKPPINIGFSVGTVRFGGNEVLAAIAVPIVIAALAAFFRYTNIGIAVRASAESADRAALLGVPVKRIETIVWVVATVLATIAIFLRAGIFGLPIGSVLGPTILLRALAAGIIGRMERLPIIFVASLALGILEASLAYRGQIALVDPLLFLIVLGTLLIQRRKQNTRVDDDQTSSWQAALDVRPIPRELKNLPEIRWGIRALSTVGVGLLLLLPALLGEGQINLAAMVLIWTMIALSLVVLTGWAGQVSLGQLAFVAIGAVVGGYLTKTMHWDISLAIVGAGIAGAIAAVVIGLPALRIRGLFLAVVTLAFALATSAVVLSPVYLPWIPQGRIDRRPLFGRIAIDTEARYYYFTLAMLLLTVAVVRGIRHSRTGRVLIGVRENARAAQAFGVNATTAKLTGFGLAGFIAAAAGAIFVHHQQSLGLSAYDVSQSRRAFTMVVIGGLGTIPGAFLGAFFIQGVDYFRNLFPSVVRPYLQFFTSGIGLIFVLLLLPGGFSQSFYGLRDRALRKVAERRGIRVPSLVADSREPTEPLPQPDDDELTKALEHATEAADADILVTHR
jgi:branched-chain amino acid transport system permease protein